MTTKTFDLTAPISLHARIGRGSLTINALDDLSQAAVTVTPCQPGSDIADRVAVELRGTVLAVVAPRDAGVFDLFGDRRGDAVDVRVDVPSGTVVSASTFSAHVVVHGRIGNADLAAGSADISVEQVDGGLRLRIGSGDCEVSRVTGSVQTRSGSGTARFGRVDGALTCGCGSGDLIVQEVHGPVRSRAGSGCASLDAVYGDVDLASGSGAMSIGLPTGRPARLDVTTHSGRVDSDLPIENVATSEGTPISVRARTGSGDIRLFRAA